MGILEEDIDNDLICLEKNNLFRITRRVDELIMSIKVSKGEQINIATNASGGVKYNEDQQDIDELISKSSEIDDEDTYREYDLYGFPVKE